MKHFFKKYFGEHVYTLYWNSSTYYRKGRSWKEVRSRFANQYVIASEKEIHVMDGSFVHNFLPEIIMYVGIPLSFIAGIAFAVWVL